MTYCIAFIGNAGTGKSHACRYFNQKSIPSISADDIAKSLLNKDTTYFYEVVDHFGVMILSSTGAIDRAKLKHIILSNPEQKQWLEKKLHPHIQHMLQAYVHTIKTPHCILEIPLLTTKAPYPYLNYIVYFDAPDEKKITHLITRDHCSIKDAERLIKIQKEYQSIQKNLANTIIYNDKTIHSFEIQLSALYKKILSA